MWLITMESTLNAIRSIRPLTPLYELYFRLLRENAITCKLNFLVIRCNRFLLTTIPRDCNKGNNLLYP